MYSVLVAGGATLASLRRTRQSPRLISEGIVMRRATLVLASITAAFMLGGA